VNLASSRSTLAQRCGQDSAERRAAADALRERIRDGGIERLRVGWCDQHGMLRGKTLMGRGAADALDDGVGMVGTVMLKDTSDRTAWPVFDPTAAQRLPGFAFAANVMLLPDPLRAVDLPWSPGTAWVPAQAWWDDGRPVAFDTRRVLQQALQALAQQGHGLRCGLEVEFHAYRLLSDPDDPAQAEWPADGPQVALLHPGYQLLSEGFGDQAEAALRIVQHTAQGLRLPLRSLEIELGPSQFEAVFDAQEALAAADAMVLLRNGVRQALRRAGFYATFVCRPPFAQVMSSGWHLHHSLTDAQGSGNAFAQAQTAGASAAGSSDPHATHAPHSPLDARSVLSQTGSHWLAGLLAHAPAMTALASPTVNAYGRFRPNALAPMAARWGRDNRGAMLRVVGAPGDAATRIENRLGEPSANPYLYFASQVHAGLDGLKRALTPPPATADPYAASPSEGQGAGDRLPMTLGAALDALAADPVYREGFGSEVLDWYVHLKRSEVSRHEAAVDKVAWDRREYFARL